MEAEVVAEKRGGLVEPRDRGIKGTKRLIDFNKTLNTLYEGAAEIQREIQREMGLQKKPKCQNQTKLQN